jgi:DNA-binding NtrC family response regulator
MMEYTWPGNIRELENLVKRYVIVGNESQIIRELSTHKPIMYSEATPSPPTPPTAPQPPPPTTNSHRSTPNSKHLSEDRPSLLEIGRRAAMKAEREAIERVLLETRWNRRQAAKVLKVSYKALLNKLRQMEEESAQSEHSEA